MNGRELATNSGSEHEDFQGAASSGGGAEGHNIPTAIEVKWREMPKDIPLQCCWTLRNAVLKGVEYNLASEEDGHIAVRKGSVGVESERLHGGAEGDWKSYDGRHPYGKDGAVK